MNTSSQDDTLRDELRRFSPELAALKDQKSALPHDEEPSIQHLLGLADRALATHKQELRQQKPVREVAAIRQLDPQKSRARATRQLVFAAAASLLLLLAFGLYRMGLDSESGLSSPEVAAQEEFTPSPLTQQEPPVEQVAEIQTETPDLAPKSSGTQVASPRKTDALIAYLPQKSTALLDDEVDVLSLLMQDPEELLQTEALVAEQEAALEEDPDILLDELLMSWASDSDGDWFLSDELILAAL